MKDFSQNFYNWLLSEKESLEKEIEKMKQLYRDRPVVKNSCILPLNIEITKLNKVMKKYKEICFRKDDENG